MEELIQFVTEFHQAFEVDIQEKPGQHLPAESYELRHRLMQEENDEYLAACQKEDLREIADALGDQLYVLLGTVISHGLQDHIVEVFKEIHRSNMSKLDHEGKAIRRADGKVLKSDRFFSPDIGRILKNEEI